MADLNSALRQSGLKVTSATPKLETPGKSKYLQQIAEREFRQPSRLDTEAKTPFKPFDSVMEGAKSTKSIDQ